LEDTLLEQRIREVTSVRIGVVGIGYVGLPLAVRLAERGFTVFGIDTAAEVVGQNSRGKSTVEGVSDEQLQQVIGEGKLHFVAVNKEPATIDDQTLLDLSGLDIFIICVPTPLLAGKGLEPDLGYIQKAQQILARVFEVERHSGRLPDERLIVLESTTYPGTTREIFPPLLARFAEHGKWYLAYSPERTNPGPHAFAEAKSAAYIPRIVGGLNADSLRIAYSFYSLIYESVEPVTGLETAEMTKLIENTFRFVSIAFANEMSRVARALHLNVWELIQKAKTKGFGLDLCYPGLIGGHCVPVDPHYLASAMRAYREPAGFIDLAERIHQEARRDALELIRSMLNRHGRCLHGSKILFFGIAYKADVGDIRESAALHLMKSLYSAGATVSYWDPVRAKNRAKPRPKLIFTEHERDRVIPTQPLIESGTSFYHEPHEAQGSWTEIRKMAMQDVDLIIIATAHEDFQETYPELLSSPTRSLLVDLCNAIGLWLQILGKPGTNPEPFRVNKAALAARGDRYALFGVDEPYRPDSSIEADDVDVQQEVMTND
jgi:UDP-N-acetyl-D-glucosamine dehydrogenase